METPSDYKLLEPSSSQQGDQIAGNNESDKSDFETSKCIGEDFAIKEAEKITSCTIQNMDDGVSDTEKLNNKVAEISMTEDGSNGLPVIVDEKKCSESRNERCSKCGAGSTQLPKLSSTSETNRKKLHKIRRMSRGKIEDSKRSHDSGLYMYIDFHGHASKRGNYSEPLYEI